MTIKRRCIICTPLEDDQQSVKERGKRKDVAIRDTPGSSPDDNERVGIESLPLLELMIVL